MLEHLDKRAQFSKFNRPLHALAAARSWIVNHTHTRTQQQHAAEKNALITSQGKLLNYPKNLSRPTDPQTNIHENNNKKTYTHTQRTD